MREGANSAKTVSCLAAIRTGRAKCFFMLTVIKALDRQVTACGGVGGLNPSARPHFLSVRAAHL